MSSVDRIEDRASELVSAARAVQEAAGQPHGSAAYSPLLASLSEALQVLSASWYSLAADAAPGLFERRRSGAASPTRSASADGALSREHEVRLVAALHDVAAACAACARTCREARSAVAPLLDRAGEGH